MAFGITVDEALRGDLPQGVALIWLASGLTADRGGDAVDIAHRITAITDGAVAGRSDGAEAVDAVVAVAGGVV